jgi:aminoglycoside phosphotransferase (APT) family kinase protein
MDSAEGPCHKQELLDGGWGKDSKPVKVGNTVHRQPSEQSSYVHQVLRFLEDANFEWAPRFLGMDEQGWEVLSFIEGYVPHGQAVPGRTWSLETMQDIFAHIRELHDLTSGSELSKGHECICHGDLSYANTVYRDGEAIAFIDWDWAHAGQRIDDVAYGILQYLSIGESETEGGPWERADLARALAYAYGLDASQRARIPARMLDLLIATRDKQLQAIKQGSPSAIKLAEAGVPSRMLKRHAWLEKNIEYFVSAMTL